MAYPVSALMPGARACLEIYAAVRSGDSVLIVSDNDTIATALTQAAHDAAEEVTVEHYDLAESRPIRTMPPGLARAYREVSIVFNVLTYPEHSGFLPEEKGFRDELLDITKIAPHQRIFHMPGVTEATFSLDGALGLVPARIVDMERETYQLAVALTVARRADVRSEHTSRLTGHPGARLQLDLGDSDNVATISTGHVALGTWGNLPSGEAYILPRGADGELVIDKAIAGIGADIDPVRLDMIGGRAILPPRHAEPADTFNELRARLLQSMERAKTPNEQSAVYSVAEFGVGTNPNARVLSLIEIEKKRGTIHIALGGNTMLGGDIVAPNHVDMVVDRPSVTLDRRVDIMRDGEFQGNFVEPFLTIDPDEVVARDHWVRRYPSKVRIHEGWLNRVWTDRRNHKLEARIGPEAFAEPARRLWGCFDGASDWESVERLIKRYRHRSGDACADDKVLHVLRVWKRFGVVTSGPGVRRGINI